MSTEKLTPQQIWRKLKLSKKRLKYARQKQKLKKVEWNEAKTNPLYDLEEVKEYFDLK